MDDYINSLNEGTIFKNDYKLVNSYNITDWDPSTIPDDITGGLITICAPTGSGKSVSLKHMMSDIHKKFESVYLMCPTAKLQDIYDFMPSSNIIDFYDEEFLVKLWDEQINLGPARKKQLVILDDIIDDINFKKSKKLDEIAHGARHLDIYLILLSQDHNSIRPTLRKNARISISFELPSKKERQKFTEEYMSLENNHIGEILYRKITSQMYNCVVCLNYKIGQGIEGKVKKFKADPKKKLKIKEAKAKVNMSSTLDVEISKPKVNNEYDYYS